MRAPTDLSLATRMKNGEDARVFEYDWLPGMYHIYLIMLVDLIVSNE